MRAAPLMLLLTCAALALPACHKKQPTYQAENQDMSLETNLADGQLPANVQIETLPPDESSTTSSRELQNGQDNPDVNDLTNAH
jgi:hypothetical protein